MELSEWTKSQGLRNTLRIIMSGLAKGKVEVGDVN